ncbi:MAG: caspase family protein, partial [Myxococcota bacterium]
AEALTAMQHEPRLALVIGNGAYAQGALSNPKHDAQLMARTLRRLGFTVMSYTDLDQRRLRRAIRDFGERLRKQNSGVGLFYYAGHGAQVEGRNYLIPTDARITTATDIPIDGVDVATVLVRMDEAQTRMNIVILDACRTNPFRSNTRTVNDAGLASIDAPRGTMLAYATAPGHVALDGAGTYGTYTAALAQEMVRPGLEIAYLFRAVRTQVRQQTDGAQIPWESSSLEGRFFFHLPPSTPSPPDRSRVAPPPVADTCPPGQHRRGKHCVLSCGSGAACTHLGLRAVDRRQPAQAREAFTEACERWSDPDGCNHLGVLLYNREGAPAGDQAKGRQLFAAACAAGSSQGCTNHGHRLYEGTAALASNPSAASVAYHKACNGGDPEGCFYAAEAHFNGDGVPASATEAAALYTRACEDDHPRACNNLAARYDNGDGRPYQPARAATLYRKACQLRDPVACNNLAWLHRKGVGVRRDRTAALRLHRQACRLGDPQGCADVGRP